MRTNIDTVKTALLSQSVHPDDVFHGAELDGMVNIPNIENEPPPTRIDNPATPECHCGTLCSKKKVTKEGPTKGRTFFGCQDQVCDFFAWDTSTEKSRPLPTRSVPRGKDSSPADVKCACGLIATESTVRGGENANRRYMHCSRSYKTCTFFEWVEDNHEKPFSRNTTSRSRTVRGSGQWRGGRQT